MPSFYQVRTRSDRFGGLTRQRAIEDAQMVCGGGMAQSDEGYVQIPASVVRESDGRVVYRCRPSRRAPGYVTVRR